MIPLKFSKLDNEKKETTLKKFWVHLHGDRPSKRRKTLGEDDEKFLEDSELYRVSSWCEKNIFLEINEVVKFYTLKEIILAPYDELKAIKKNIDDDMQLKKDMKINCSPLVEYYSKQISRRKPFSKKVVSEFLDVSVCPYCNRNFMNSGGKNTHELDHFYGKNEFPIFAISFYNLIPVCPSCNRNKSTYDFQISPHEIFEENKTDNLLTFTYRPLKADFITNFESVAIDIKIKNENIKISVEEISLQSLSQIHVGLIQEMIYKSTKFNKKAIFEIVELFGGKLSIDECYRLLYGNYLSSNDYDKEPLSKMRNDILKELDILK